MKLRTLAAATLFALAASTSAQALTFTFDPTGTLGGTNDITGIATIDQAPGSAWSPTAVTAVQNYLGNTGDSTSFTLYYQANLNTMLGTSSNILFPNGSGGNYFNFIAGFGETVLNATAATGNANFAFDPSNTTNFFNMYQSSSVANDLTGEGFGSGKLILSASIVAVPSSGFTISTTAAPVTLDQSPDGINSWPSTTTVSGAGATNMTLQISFLDSLYFPDLNLSDTILFSFFNASQIDPFNQVDPSRCFNTVGNLCAIDGGGNYTGGLQSVASVGAINGSSGPGFIFQADGNQSLRYAVPEPGSMALLGLGLFLVGLRKARGRAS